MATPTTKPWQTTLNTVRNQPTSANAPTLPPQYNKGMSMNTGLVGSKGSLNQTAGVGNADINGMAGLLAPTKVGTKATTPDTNVEHSSNTLSTGYTQTPRTRPTTTPPVPSPGSTPYDPNNPNPYYAGQVGSFDFSNDPTFQKLIGEREALKSNLPTALANIQNDTTRGIPEGTMQSREVGTNSMYSGQLAAKEAELSNYLAAKGTTLGALESAMTGTAPQNQLGFLTSSISGKPLYGDGSIGGLAGLSYQAGQINNAGNLAGQGQNQAIAIKNARNDTTQLGNLLKTSNLNQNQLAISNWLGNTVAKNLSDPTLAPIQNAITSAINHYALAQGISPADLTNSLLSQSGSQSIMSALSNLDTSAYNNYTNTGNVATGAGVTAPATNLGTATNTTSGITTGGNKYVITP